MVILDGLASLPQTQGWNSKSLEDLHQSAVQFLQTLVPSGTLQVTELRRDTNSIAIGPFKVPLGSLQPASIQFDFGAPTTLENARRVLRACQLMKPILLEGSPGVGKTSLITALAAVSCQRLCRINLSDQTDLADLFGSDLPVEDGYPGEFAWKDAAFLQALQQGDWVLLDEMNLASQSVLEGLNAILDHRGTVYVPELGRSFVKHPNFRLFAAQNPAQQGGGRKGLPKSFINRFTKVYMRELASEDLLIIATTLRPNPNEEYLRQMIGFNSQIHIAATVQRTLGRQGSPWEFNLRDIMRWLALGQNQSKLELNPDNPVEFVGDIYVERFRSMDDRQVVATLIRDAFKTAYNHMHHAHILMTPKYTQLGHSLIERKPGSRLSLHTHPILQRHLNAAQAMAKCIEKGWLVILVGTAGTGKTTLLRHFASLHGTNLVEFHANSATDTTDLLGSFEQEEDAYEHRKWTREVHRSLARASQHAPFTTPDSLEWQRFSGGRRESLVQLLNNVTAEEVREELEGCDKRLGHRDAKGRFVWLDGPLVQALKEGSWFVLDNANLCNPSVLDRLNSLCELGGTLNLTERGLVEGQVEVIRPHSQFRLFMTVDPANGELSRAMRNRGLEINVDHVISSEDQLRLSLSRRDSVIREQGHEVRLPQIPEHLSLGPLQSLLRLLPAFEKLPFDAKVSVLLQRTPRNAYGLLRRLTELRSSGDMSFSLMASHGAIVNFLQLYLARLDLPALFLASQVCSSSPIT
jgi:midasin